MKIWILYILLILPFNALSQLESMTNVTRLVKEVNVTKLRGKEYEVSFTAKNIVADSLSGMQLYTCQVGKSDWDIIEKSGSMFTASPDNKDWQQCAARGRIDGTARKLWIYLITSGNGDFYFDNVEMKVKNEQGVWTAIPVENGDLENSHPAKPLKGWKNARSLPEGVTASIVSFDPPFNRSLHIHASGGVRKTEVIYGHNNKAGKYVNINGIPVYYETYGEGAPLLLLHGNGGSIHSFAKQIPEFAKEYKVIAVDTRGQGRSVDTTTGTFTYDQFAEDMKVLLDSLGLKQVTIVGWSDGGNTGLILAHKYPEYVRNLVIMGANLNPSDTAIKKSILIEARKDIRKLETGKDKENIVNIRLLTMLLNEPHIVPGDLKRITARTLVLAGEKDLVIEAHTRLIAGSIPNAEMIIFKGETHFIVEENPALFNRTVLSFLSGKNKNLR